MVLRCLVVLIITCAVVYFMSTMSDRRWSRLKTKLLRRSSTSTPNKTAVTSIANISSSSAHDLKPPILKNRSYRNSYHGKTAAEIPAVDPNFTSSTSPNTLTSHSSPPPLFASPNRPSFSSLADSLSPPHERADSPTSSIRGRVPEESPSGSSSRPNQHQHQHQHQHSSRRIDDSVDQNSTSHTATKQHPTIPQRSRDPRNTTSTNRRSLPPEFLSFPTPPTGRSNYDLTPSLPLTPPTSRFDRPTPTPATGSPFPPTYTLGQDGPSSASAEPPSTAPLDAVAEKPSGGQGYQSFFPPPTSFSKRPSLSSRRQSLLPASHQHLVSTLLDTGSFAENDGPINNRFVTGSPGMGPRKIWVKRPGGSATLVPTSDDALVDELRDQVVLKYANSLGRTFDSPDLIIRIATREGLSRQTTPDRILSPEEPLLAVIDSYYPGGQTIEEALIVEIPPRRTPKPSPRHHVYYNHQSEPGEHGDYFPLMPVNPNVPTPPTHPSNSSASVNAHPAPSISILTTGVAPTLPSPGNRGSRHSRRPPLTRHTTNSPTILGQPPSAKDVTAVPNNVSTQASPSIPTPPGPAPESPQTKSLTPPARGASPRPRPVGKPKKSNRTPALSGAFSGLIEGTVPPINVLIVEDNNINQRLLEAFMKKLSVRWKCAGNGAEAVKKWREGGFHLVLMDIQLPVMNGLDATKEIRRLERLNGVGVFPKKESGRASASNANASTPDPVREEDTLHDLSLFKSPVIIVALTASSLQSDRHEALAAGCNDFLTKPVRFEWLEQKVTEWGCMQALIDFEGWRKWRGFADDANSSSSPTLGYASPMQRASQTGGVIRKGSPSFFASSSSPASASKKWEGKSPHNLKRNNLIIEDSSGTASGDGSDSPASLHVEELAIKDGF